MNVNILRLSRRDKSGARFWIVPGFGNGAKVLPASRSLWPETMSAHWPAKDRNGDEILRGARLDWHKSLIKNEIRMLLASCRQNGEA